MATENEEFEFRLRLENEQNQKRKTLEIPTGVSKQRPDRLRISAYDAGGNYGIQQAAADVFKSWANSAANLGVGISQPILHPIKTIGGIASAVMNPIDTARAVKDYAMSRYGGLNRALSTASLDPFGAAGDVAAVSGIGKGLVGLGKSAPSALSKMKPVIYNDAKITGATNSAISKIKSVVEPLRNEYKAINAPLATTVVDSETFNKALSIVPKSIRQDFIDAYGTGVVDARGRPMTNLGNLHKMELELKDFINQPKFGEKISAADFNIAEKAKELKSLRLSLMPEDAVRKTLELDKIFKPVITATNELLPKLADPNGVARTEYLYKIMHNPNLAGMRDYIRGLKKIGIDLTPEMKIFEKSLRRRAIKRAFNSRIAGGATEGAVIGTILK